MNNIEFSKASVRLLYDMVAADGYISDRELDILQYKLEKDYNLTIELSKEASRISFGEALSSLAKDATHAQKKKVFEDLKLVAGVGENNINYNHKGGEDHTISSIVGRCSPEEARLLLLCSWALFRDATVFSLSKSKFRFSKHEIVYLEPETDDDMHEELAGETSGSSGYYEEYKAKLALLGFDFIYIPKICKFLKRKNREHKLIPVLRYVNPLDNYTDETANEVAKKLERLEIYEFAKQMMAPVDGLFDNFPVSLMMKIKTSEVFIEGKMKKKDDFILIPVYGSGAGKEPERCTMSQLIETLCNQYMLFTNQVNPLSYSWSDRMFHFHGFDRTILNLVMSEHFSPTKMHHAKFDLKDECLYIYFGSDSSHCYGVRFTNGLKRLLVYMFIAYYSQTSSGGLYVLGNEDEGLTYNGIDIYNEMCLANKAYSRLIELLPTRANADLFHGIASCITDIKHTLKAAESLPPELSLKEEFIKVNGKKIKRYYISRIDKNKLRIGVPYSIDNLVGPDGNFYNSMNRLVKNFDL